MKTKLIAWGQRLTRLPIPQPPGNSLAIIDEAYATGYDGVELDVQFTKDKVAVLHHDLNLESATGVRADIAESTAEELRKIRLQGNWFGPPCYVESLASGLKRNGSRGLVMVDSHANPTTVTYLIQAVREADFDDARLLLLTYTDEIGKALKSALPRATVLMKAPHDFLPPALSADFARKAVNLDGILVPSAKYPDTSFALRHLTRRLGLKLAIYMHDDGPEGLLSMLEAEPDYITSVSPDTFEAARTAEISRMQNSAASRNRTEATQVRFQRAIECGGLCV